MFIIEQKVYVYSRSVRYVREVDNSNLKLHSYRGVFPFSGALLGFLNYLPSQLAPVHPPEHVHTPLLHVPPLAQKVVSHGSAGAVNLCIYQYF